MKLLDLEPQFVGRYHAASGPGDRTSYDVLTSVDGAQGILFICPKCGNHSVLCWFKNPRNAPPVPDTAFPRPGRWTFTGDTFDVISLQPSIDLSKVDAENPASPGRCYWHGYVTNGQAS
jgi:hypothetical protein